MSENIILIYRESVMIMRKYFAILMSMMLMLIIILGLSFCGESEALDRNGFFPQRGVYRYQKSYAMNFEIWKPMGLPAGWYATFDGFPVAQIAENRWVYGQIGSDGAIVPTDVLVGSVIPSEVPGLLRVAFVWGNERFFNDREFLKIREYMCNRMGWLYDSNISTIIAWHVYQPYVWIWLGNRWRKFTPYNGEYAWQMLKRLSPYIIEELRKSGNFYLPGEPYEIADIARQWGYIWLGKVSFSELQNHRDSNSSESSYSLRSSSSSSSGGGNSPSEPSGGGSQWDID